MYHVLKGKVNKHLFQSTALNTDASGMAYLDLVLSKLLWEMLLQKIYSLGHLVAYKLHV